MNRDQTCKTFLSAGVLSLLLSIQTSNASVLFESASNDPLSDYSGITVGGASQQIYGASFELFNAAHVTAIGGMFFDQGDQFPDDIFGTLIRLPSLTALPVGDGLSGADIVGSVVFNVGTSTPKDVVAPLNVDLSPGYYALVFGSGEYGTVGVAALPPTSQVFAPNYLGWNTDATAWFGGEGYGRVFVLGNVSPVPEPGICAMMLAGLGLLGAIARRRKQQQTSA